MPDSRPVPQLSIAWFIRAGACIGLLYGCFEAVASQFLSHWSGSLSWKNGTSFQALVVSPLFYLAVFLLLTLPFLFLSRWIRRVPWDAVMLWVLSGIAAYTGAALMRHWFSVLASVIMAVGVATAFTRWYLARRDGRALWLSRLTPRVAVAVAAIGLGAQLVEHWGERYQLADLLPAPAGVPNVLLIVMDTQRGDHLTSNGYARPTTPRLAQLAREGLNFRRAMAPAPTTLPSHASMMTGRRVREHQAGVGGRRFLDDRFPTIAEAMRDHGYATGGFVANIYWTGRHTGLDRGFIHYEDFYGTVLDGICRTVLGRALAYSILPRLGAVDIPGRKRAAVVNRELLDWLDDIPRGRPFFAFLNYFDVHAPYLPPREYHGRIAPGSRYHTDRIEIGAWNEHDHLPPSRVLATWRDRYDESLMYLDHEIGALMDSLKARGVLGRTVVIVTGDHGESFGEHGMVHHGGSLYQEQIRVPLLIRDTSGARAGETITKAVDLRSLPTTIADLADLEPSPFPGTSLLHYTAGDSLAGPAALSEAPRVPANPKSWQTSRGWVTSLVEGKWHALMLESGEIELYDLDQDPEELHNLAATSAGQEVMASLADDIPPAPPRPVPADAGEGEP